MTETDIRKHGQDSGKGENARIAAEYGLHSDLDDFDEEIVFTDKATPAAMVFTAMTSLSNVKPKDVYDFFVNLPSNVKLAAIEVYDLSVKAYPDMRAKFDEFSIHVKAALDPTTLKENAKASMIKAEAFFAELAVKAKENATPAAEAFGKKFGEFMISLSAAYESFVEKARENPTVIKASQKVAEIVEAVRQSKAFDQAMVAVAGVAGKLQQTAEDFRPKRNDSGQQKSL